MKPNREKSLVGPGEYISEFDQFIHTFLSSHPEVEADQKRGWYIWWDHKIDLEDLEKQNQYAVPVKSYQYE